MSGILVAPTFAAMSNLRDVNNAAIADKYGLTWDAATSKHIYEAILTGSSTDYVKVDGSQALTANWDAGSFAITAETFVSDVATGTAPFTVSSTTVVSNLNADQVDGCDVIDEDNMASDSATSVPTQQSVKAYVDNIIAGVTYLESTDIDTLAEINAILGDATLVTVEATDASGYGWVIDEDDLVSDSDTKVPTQQSVKAYVDALSTGGSLPVADTTGIAKGSVDATKIVRLEVDGLTTATTRVLTVQDADGTIELTGHAHAASDITSGTLTHERGGLEFDASTVAIGDVIAGTGTGTMGLVTATGHSDGDVLTLQADGTLDFETPAGGGGGGGGGLTITAKSADYTAANGDLVVCDASSGAFNIAMPASPSTDDRIGIYLEAGSFTFSATVQGNGKVLAEFGTTVKLNTPGDIIVFQFDGTKWVIESNGIQTYSLGLLTAASIDEDDDGVRLYDGDAIEDFEKRATVKSMLAPYIEDSTLGTDAGDIVYRPTANTHWTNLKTGGNGEILVLADGLPSWGDSLYQLVSETLPGKWLLPPTTTTIPQSSQVTAADKLYTVPVFVGRGMTIDAIAIDVNATGTATTARLGIYESQNSATPGALLLDAGTVDVSSTGQKTLAVSQTLNAGRYWLSVVLDGTCTLAAPGSSEVLYSLGRQTLGSSAISGLRNDHAYGALPDPHPGVDVGLTSALVIAIRPE